MPDEPDYRALYEAETHHRKSAEERLERTEQSLVRIRNLLEHTTKRLESIESRLGRTGESIGEETRHHYEPGPDAATLLPNDGGAISTLPPQQETLEQNLVLHDSQDPTTIAIPKSGPDYSDRGYEDNDGNGRSAVVKPTLEYCTQACLLGLVRKKELDGRCPNYALHKNGINQNNRHTVTQSQLVDIIERQLLSTPKTNCECQFENKRSMSYPFKITLTGLGYTFVGKAVQERYRAALVHESQIYTRLLRLQGSAIPVHLGLIELTIPYPLPDQFVTLPYMMFTSYAGKAVPSECWESDDSDEEEEEEEDEEYSDSENSDSGSTRDMGSPVVNYRSETERTLKELSDMGFYEQHTNPANIRWCDNAQRVMRTDFDHAFLEPCEEDLIFDYNSTVCTTLETGTKTEFKVVHDLESDSRDSKRVKYSY